MNATKTYHGPVNAEGQCVRFWYDRSLRLWTAYIVTGTGDDADQISDAIYEVARNDVALDVSAYSYLMRR